MAELRFKFSRSSGPGGANVNKRSTKCTLFYRPAEAILPEADKARLLAVLAPRLNRKGELVIACDEHRTQRANKQATIARLVATVRRALKTRKHRQKTQPTASSVERRLRSKRANARIKSGRSCQV